MQDKRKKKLLLMHAKEEYAQKEVLATEVKELQSRVSGELNKEGKYLMKILLYVHRAFETRLTTASKEKELAAKEKMEKESLARKAIAHEESQMEKLLQQFLVDRGHVVDTLDGNISKKCQDINLLKESLHQAVLLSGLLSYIQTPIIATEAADCSTDDHVIAATQKPINSGKSVTFDVSPEHGLFSFQKPIESGKSVSLDVNPENLQKNGKLVTSVVPPEQKQLTNKIQKDENGPRHNHEFELAICCRPKYVWDTLMLMVLNTFLVGSDPLCSVLKKEASSWFNLRVLHFMRKALLLTTVRRSKRMWLFMLPDSTV
ncbi:myosin heavy chain, non-muscle [Artemisia annua]|uniref:Myosin heavy chain, non-muscle n=1 Tax=Artemisia annua TaxID=35608 RepID=A0A2U1P2C5_ARTAN|nr:myosin heavy chain, non-muscle [Artemisia annua]